jgi:hypothetical protein
MKEKTASRGTANSSGRDQSKALIEWLAWGLQLVVGFLVGCGIGYQAARLLLRSDLDHRLLMAGGLGLVCGAFTSFYGNRAWMAPSVFAAPEPAVPRRPRAFSLLIGCVGLAVTLLTAVHGLITGTRFGHGPPSTGFNVFPLIASVLPGFLVVHALRTGTGLWIFGIVNREETPLLFWAYVVINISAFLGLLSFML